MAADPNMRCVCGYRIFRERVVTVPETVEQWLLFDNGAYGGFGSTPFGTFFGSGAAGAWGLFEAEVDRVHKQLSCENCNRLRSDTPLGGVGVFGSYRYGDSLFILVTDTSLISCLRVRFTSTLESVSVSPTRYLGTPLPLAAPTPAVTAASPPPGAPIAGVLRVLLPDVDHDANFVVSLVDVCAGTEVSLTILPLESAVQVHAITEAELDGLPKHLIEVNTIAQVSSSQPGTGSLPGIPFDRCKAVIEYDARFGTLPTAQGWTHAGAGLVGDFTLIDGGVLNIATTVDSYFEKEIVLGAAEATVHLFTKFRVQSSTFGVGEGFEARAEIAPGALGNYQGVRYVQHQYQLDDRKLDGSAQSVRAFRFEGTWTQLFVGARPGTSIAFSTVDQDRMEPTSVPVKFGTGSVGGASPSLRARFGDFEGSTLLAQLRNFVASTPGRFMRAFFRSYAAVSSPVLRLYFVSDLDTSASARFKIRYGNLGLGTNPYSLGALSVGTTAFFNTKNVMVEVAVSLPSLTAMAPFWFSVERDWANVDDVTDATLHLLSATVRSS